MKKLIVAVMALSTLLFVGCGDDDDDNGNGDTTITVTADTTAAPASPLVYNDTVWDNVTATSILLLTGTSLPVSPGKSPLGPSKALAAPDSVDVQAIKKDGRLYLRFQWSDYNKSMSRDNWELNNKETFRFTWYEDDRGEDQLFFMLEGAPGGGWDTWNWRILTTGTQNLAEDLTYRNDSLIEDDGINQVAFQNRPKNSLDPTQPTYVHDSEWVFTGEILYKSDLKDLDIWVQANAAEWDFGQTVPGWYIVDDDIDWAAESRWDVQAVYNYDHGIGIPGRYTLVLARDLTTVGGDDLDMAGVARVKSRIGILDDYNGTSIGDTKRKFSGDFWLVLP